MRWFWDHSQALELVVLAFAAPAVLYRVWRWWADPASLVLTAGALFAISIWPWALCDIEMVWVRLPPQAQAFHAAGGIGVLASASAWVLVFEACGRAAYPFRRKKIQALIAAAALTLAAVAGLTVSEVATPGGGDFLTYLAQPRRDSWNLLVATLVGHAFAALVLAHLAVLAARRIDRTPAGRGLALLGAAGGSVAVAVATRGIGAELFQWRGHPPPAWCGPAVQASAITVGALLAILALTWPPVAIRHQALHQLRQVRPLRDALIRIFPGLAPPQPFSVKMTELLPEWIGQIQDGLSLLAQCRDLPLEASAPPQDRTKHIHAVVGWLRGQSISGMSTLWLQAPLPLTDTEWIRTLAGAYNSANLGSR